jgi:glutamate-ammonia-ligase adenylyltransferase
VSENRDIPQSGALERVACDRFERWREALLSALDGREARAASPHQPTASIDRFDNLPAAARRAWTCSDFIAEYCIREPLHLLDLLDDDKASNYCHPAAIAAMVRDALAGCTSEEALMSALRRVRNKVLVTIAWRDLSSLATLDQTLDALTELADASVRESLRILEDWQRDRYGTPRDAHGEAQALLVLALGKLGSRELNFSSDIDLIFAYPESGETDHPDRPLANQDFFLRLARRLIKILSERTPEGFAFRVDMRLRPFGEGGALVASFDSLEDYYQTYGRDWERYALLRARVIAGDESSAEGLMTLLRPFVFRRYLDFAALESLRDVKARINEDLSHKGEAAHHDDLKRGRGGIRELEFITQSFQLLHGGREPTLQHGTVLEMLSRLMNLEHLDADSTADLTNAWDFLRKSENRLQARADQQRHILPVDSLERESLASAMGQASWEQYLEALANVRATVCEHFDAVMGNGTPGTSPTEPGAQSESATAGSGGSAMGSATKPDSMHTVFTEIWLGNVTSEQALATLGEAGYTDPEQTYHLIEYLRENYRTKAIGERGQRRLLQLVPAMLDSARQTSSPDQTISRAIALVEAIEQRAAYLALLVERPIALENLIHLIGASPWLAKYLTLHPNSLDELLDPRTLFAPPDAQELRETLAERLMAVEPGDTEAEMDALRRFQQGAALRVAAADLAHAVPLMVVSDHLTELAEVCLQRTLSIVERDWHQRYGQPMIDARPAGASDESAEVPARREAGFCVLAYGKLGGFELGYGSDLDLVFLHESGSNGFTSGDRQLDNLTYFARLGQRLIHFISTRTAAGIMYEVDPRLRPSGASGLLVATIDAFEQYQHQEAWTWEHQALVRARFVAGDRRLGAQFDRVRLEVLRKSRDPEQLRTEVRDMRLRMQRELGSKSAGSFDIKQDPGGIADIEFMVQYGALRWSKALGDHLRFTDNIRLLEGFEQCGLMTEDDVRTLADAYRAYRSKVHEQALQDEPSIVSSESFSDERERVTDVWARLMEA